MGRIYRSNKILDNFNYFGNDWSCYFEIKIMLLFKKKKFLIYGLGLSGKSCFTFLNKNNYIDIYDDKTKLISKKFKKYLISRKKLNRSNYDYIIISPGININNCSIKKFLKKNKSKIISELDVFYCNYLNNFKITITGTNGKSTTAKLLYDILKKAKSDVRLVGNIGYPILNEKNIKTNTIFIIEASSYQIDYSKYFKTDYAIILNLSPDHLERHVNFLNYAKVKFKLIKNQNKNGYAFINKKEKIFINMIKKLKSKPKIFKVNINSTKNIINKIKNNYFKNYNNLANLKFAIEILRKLKIKIKISDILQVVNSFKGLKYRQEIILDKKDILIINDSKSTSFSSSTNLLKSYRNIYWVLGGMIKLGDKFKLEKKYFPNIKSYIYGKDKLIFSNILNSKIKSKIFLNLEKALLALKSDIQKDNNKKTIIFSPAAASFDQFKNFEHRGRYFNLLTKKLNLI